MKEKRQSCKELLPHLFRQEYAKMVAVLCHRFGLKCIEIAEDIASDTFLKASEYWAINQVSENPTAQKTNSVSKAGQNNGLKVFIRVDHQIPERRSYFIFILPV